MNESSRYTTLPDYLWVVREHRLLILGTTVAFACAALGWSLLQTPRYTAEAALSFPDLAAEFRILGQQAPPEFAPEQRSAIAAEELASPDLARRVERRLGGEVPADELESSISAESGAQANSVLVRAEGENPEEAADIANAYAREVKVTRKRELEASLDQAIESLREGLGDSATVEGQIDAQMISQLRTLREIANPVEIERRAEVPGGAPSLPRTLRNTLLAGLNGLLFGVLAAFIRDSVDRRLRGAADVYKELSLPVLARIAESSLGSAGFGRADGSDGNDEGALEPFRVLRANLELLRAGRRLRSLLVTSGLPQEGKSTVASSLARAMAVAGRRTLLVECDLRRPVLADRLGLEREPGLADYLLGEAGPPEVLQAVDIATDVPVHMAEAESPAARAPQLVCITAGRYAQYPAELLSSERFRDFVAKVSKAYDRVVIDSSPLLSVVDPLEIVPLVDAVLLCVRVSKTTRDEARAAKEALARLPDRASGVVVTGLKPERELDPYYYAHGAEQASG